MSLGWPMQPVTDQSQMPPFLQTSADRYHLEPHPEHLCGACPYAYPPMPPIGPHPGFEDWSQIRYPPPPTAMEHPPPLPNSRLFRLVSPCPLPHSRTHTQASQTHAKGKVNGEGQKLHPWPLGNRLVCSLPSPGQDLPAQGCSRALVWDRKGWVREQGQQEGSLRPARPGV